jgi:predicted Zn finger-like uncharacterized protein
MSLAVSCPHCQSRVRVPDDAVGRDVRCPNCQQVFRVGGIEPAASVSRRPAPTGTAPSGDFQGAAAGGRPPGTSNVIIDFLLFRRMIAPIVIQVLFWIGLLICVIMAGFQVISGILLATGKSGSPWLAVLGIFGGLVILTVGPFVVRLYAELLILSFRIYETLTEIRDRLDRKP